MLSRRDLLAGLSASAAAAPHGPRKARAAAMQPANLVCEYLRNPLGIDETQPRLSWESTPVDAEARGLRQTAYQVVVRCRTNDTMLLASEYADLRVIAR